MPFLSEALKDADSQKSYLTGEPFLDAELASIHLSTYNAKPLRSGLPAHSFTELSGFPGNGQDNIVLSIALDALQKGNQVIYISCDWSRFPIECARQLPGWNSSRFETRIEEIFVNTLEDFFMIEGAEYSDCLVIVERYDHLIKSFWSKPVEARAYECLFGNLRAWSRHACIIALCGVTKYFSTDGRIMFCPKSEPAVGIDPQEVVRLMLYKNQDGINSLSTGFSFKIENQKILPITYSPNNLAILLPMLTCKRRLTPSRFSPASIRDQKNTFAAMPQKSAMKRRNSLGTPIKSFEVKSRSMRTPNSQKTEMQHLDRHNGLKNAIKSKGSPENNRSQTHHIPSTVGNLEATRDGPFLKDSNTVVHNGEGGTRHAPTLTSSSEVNKHQEFQKRSQFEVIQEKNIEIK